MRRDRLTRALTVAALAACPVVGGYPVCEAYRKNTTFAPTHGRVLSASVRQVTTGDDNARTARWEPVVWYAYVVDDERHSAGHLTPVVPFGSAPTFADEAAARAAARRYEPGQAVTVHYDPARPDDAFLVPAYDYGPFLVWLLSTAPVPLALTYSAGRAEPRRRRPTPSHPAARTAVALDPRRWVRRGSAAVLASVAASVGVNAVYVALAGPSHPGFSGGLILMGFLISAGLALLLLGYALPCALALGRGTVAVVAGPHRLGDCVAVSLDQRLRRPGRVRWVEFTLACDVGDGDDRRRVFETIVRLDAPSPFIARGRLRARADLALPPQWPDERPPGKRRDAGDTPPTRRGKWTVTARVAVRWGHQLVETPVEVTRSSDATASRA